MADPPDTPEDPKPRLNKEYEDPHYHDEDETPVPDEGPVAGHRIPMGKKAPRRLPPPRRRFLED